MLHCYRIFMYSQIFFILSLFNTKLMLNTHACRGGRVIQFTCYSTCVQSYKLTITDVQCTSCINSVLFYLLSYYRCTDFFTYILPCVQTYLLIITGEQDGCSPGEQVDDGVSGDDVCGGLQRSVLGHSPSEGTGATQLWCQK